MTDLDGTRSTEVDIDELTRLALAADPDAPLPDDAVPWSGHGPDHDPLLPDWYMPAPMPGHRRLTGWRRVLAWILVISAVAVVASGLCNTYGELVIAADLPHSPSEWGALPMGSAPRLS